MSFQPKGIVWLPDAIRAVGERKYGQDAWIGSDVSSLNNEWLRAKAAKDPLAASTAGERVKAAVTQWRAVAELMRQEFIGTAPKHKDAVPVYLFGFDSNGPLPWTIWRDDQDANAMLIAGEVHTDGRRSFHPGKHGWFPTAAPISGRLYLIEADFERLLRAAASSDLPEVTVPPDDQTEMESQQSLISESDDHQQAKVVRADLEFMAASPISVGALVRESEGERGTKPVSDTEVEANIAPDYGPAKRRGGVGRKIGSGAYDDDAPHLSEMLRLLSEGTVKSVRAAAGRVQSGARGNSPEGKTKRLAKKFSHDVGTEPSSGKTWADMEDKWKANGRLMEG